MKLALQPDHLSALSVLPAKLAPQPGHLSALSVLPAKLALQPGHLSALPAPWPVLSVPADSAEAIGFRDLQDDEVAAEYRRMEREAIAAPSSPVKKAQ